MDIVAKFTEEYTLADVSNSYFTKRALRRLPATAAGLKAIAQNADQSPALTALDLRRKVAAIGDKKPDRRSRVNG